jgi:GT2 family glycosyltransferase
LVRTSGTEQTCPLVLRCSVAVQEQYVKTQGTNVSKSRVIGKNTIDMPEVETRQCCQSETLAASSSAVLDTREQQPVVRGKFLYIGEEKLALRGVTYGTFRPDAHGNDYHTPEVVEQDFAQMIQHGINAIRTYTVPPPWLLDIAQTYGLRVLVGLPWEQHIAFLDDQQRVRSIEARLREGVRACAGHPAILGYAVGNEIPAPIVRWYGRKPVERFLKRLCWAAKTEDPNGLVTYVNYPSTEYLQLPFLDFVCFNVYLEARQRLEAYLARLQNLAGERPLVMSEIGLDSRRHGEDVQAHVLDWQVRVAFSAGCAGAFVFAWTDEWHRGGHDIEDWDFGLIDRQRRPKPALKTVGKAFDEAGFPPDFLWPRISVVVCSYNGARTIRDCLKALCKVEYPDFEVIVVDDGSTDATSAIAREYEVRLIQTENRGLSNARNMGLAAAAGEIVAYIDDDAYPDPHWLKYLAATFVNTEHVGVGGPNLPPAGDGRIADCVANAPGGPVHVLLTDERAEHIPGCNMAFRKVALQAIGGFDQQFRTAGDDVDVCWRLQQCGWTLGFSPAAMVWHHRRNSVWAYWRQQQGYGRAEAMLERKWPEKYNHIGHLTWSGRVYGKGLTYVLGQGQRIYHGVWGSAPFQSLYQPAPGIFPSLPLMPEWYLVISVLVVLSGLGTFWSPLLWAVPLLVFGVGVSMVQASLGAARASFTSACGASPDRLKLYALTAWLHMLQPAARLWGRLRYGLTPWRRRGVPSFAVPQRRAATLWSESWQAPDQRLTCLEAALRTQGTVVVRGGDYDRWDLEIRGGMCGAVRTRMAIEEHGSGRQLVHLQSWPCCSPLVLTLSLLFGLLAILAARDQAWVASVMLQTGVILLLRHAFLDCAAATATYLHALKHLHVGESR